MKPHASSLASLLVFAVATACVEMLPEGKEAARREGLERLALQPAEGAPDADPRREALADGLLTADEAVRVAVAANPALRARLEEAEIARAELLRALLPPNPVLDADLILLDEPLHDPVELVATWSVIELLLIPLRTQIADARFERERAEAAGAVIDLAVETRGTYRRLQAQLALADTRRAELEAASLSHEAAARLHEAGNVPERMRVVERAAYEEAKVEWARERARATRLQEDLAYLLGSWHESHEGFAVEPLPEPPPLAVDPDSLESAAVAASLDLAAARHAILALGRSSGLERIEELFPVGEAGVEWERDEFGEWHAGPAARATIPLFDFGQGAAAAVAARLRQALDRYRDVALRVRRTARASYVDAASAQANGRYYAEIVLPLHARAVDETQRQVNAMHLGVFDLLEAKQHELAAKRRQIETWRDHWLARARLEAVLMGRLPERRFGLRGMDDGPESRGRDAGAFSGGGDDDGGSS